MGLVSIELRLLVEKHQAAILAELERWPNAAAPARDYSVFGEPPRPDERIEPQRPRAITSSPRARRFLR
jgi:hypothetical protein